MGEGNFSTSTQQLALTDQALDQIADIVVKSWKKIPLQGETVASFANICQGPKEPYTDFVNHLIIAIERQVESYAARTMLIKQVAFENCNQDCRAALTPIYNKPETSINDMLRVCQNDGTHSHKAQLLAAAINVYLFTVFFAP